MSYIKLLKEIVMCYSTYISRNKRNGLKYADTIAK